MKTATLIYKAPEEGNLTGFHSVHIIYDSQHEYKVEWSENIQRQYEQYGVDTPGFDLTSPEVGFATMVMFLKENYEDPRTQLSQVSSTDETN